MNEEELEKELENELDKRSLVANRDAINDLKSHPGWALFEKAMNNRLKKAKDIGRLSFSSNDTQETKLGKVYAAQSKVNVYRTLLNWVDSTVQEYDKEIKNNKE